MIAAKARLRWRKSRNWSKTNLKEESEHVATIRKPISFSISLRCRRQTNLNKL